MNFAKRLLMVVGVVALAATFGALLAPKTAHAIVATFVQVVNTPTHAIPVVQAPAASELYVYQCSSLAYSDIFVQCIFPPVPAGKTLIVEAVSIFSGFDSGAEPAIAYLYPRGGLPPLPYIPLSKQENQPSELNSYTGAVGARVSLLSAPWCVVQLSAFPTNGEIDCTISGYLVPAI